MLLHVHCSLQMTGHLAIRLMIISMLITFITTQPISKCVRVPCHIKIIIKWSFGFNSTDKNFILVKTLTFHLDELAWHALLKHLFLEIAYDIYDRVSMPLFASLLDGSHLYGPPCVERLKIHRDMPNT